MLLCRINWGCFICPPPPPLKLLKLSLVLCCYAVGPEVMLNQWSPGRLMWLRWCFLHPWKTVSNQDNSVVLAIMQFCINQAGAFNPLPPLKIMQLRWRCWWQSCSLFSGDSQSLAWLVIPSDAPQQLVASIPVQYRGSNVEKPDVYVASNKLRASWSAYMSAIAPSSACIFAQKQKSQWWYIMIYEFCPKAAIFQSDLHPACVSSRKPQKNGKI